MSAPLNGLILAGGRSSRMGRDKAALDYHGTDQTHHLAALLAPFVEIVFASIRPEQSGSDYLKTLSVVTDHYAAPTPLNGIASAMRLAPDASWLVIAVDMPSINDIAIQTLIAERNAGASATCFESPARGGPDPLFAIWEGHLFPLLDAMLAESRDHICPRTTLKKLGAHILKNKIPAYMLDNINTPEELYRLRRQSA